MFQTIPIKEIHPSHNNYRRSFDQTALDELTASVKSRGVLQPILVRPLNGAGKKKKGYEIVAGHRRFQAATIAGLKELPAIVKVLSDEDAIEVQVIENSQREDPNPIDEAFGFRRLIEMGKHTPETLAAKIDRSAAYVLGRLKLAELDGKVQEAIASGKIGPGHALLFTRLKNTGDQKNFLQRIIEVDMSVRDAAREMGKYSMRLADAAFDASKCEMCASRSRNQSALFPELKQTDECMDRSCFQTKTKAHHLAFLKEKAAEGFKTHTDPKTVEKLIAYDAKGSAGIVPNKKDAQYYGPYFPPDYKTRCAACTEHHAYYTVERKTYSGKELHAGEICLDKKCLDKMMKAGKKGENKERTTCKQDEALEQMRRNERAAKCRDRFLLRELTPRVEASEEARKRLLLYAVLKSYWKCANAVGAYLEIHGRKVAKSARFDGEPLYDIPHPFSLNIPDEILDGAVGTAILTLMENISGDDLLVLAATVGLNVAGEFTIDREYLDSQSFKKKEELIRLAGELAIEVDAKLSKEKLIEFMLAQDLRGRLSCELAEALEGEKNWCRQCEEDIEDCVCVGDNDKGKEPEDEDEATAQTMPEDDPTMPEPTSTGKGRKTKSEGDHYGR